MENRWQRKCSMKYAKDFMKIRFETNDNLNKPLKFHALTLTVSCVFKEDNEHYPQIILRRMFVWVSKILQYERIETSTGIDLDKTDKSKECEVCNFNYFNYGFKFDSKVCNNCNSRITAFGFLIQ